MEEAVGDGQNVSEAYTRAMTWIPVVVSVLLVAIVAVFIFTAPNQIVTPKESGYLIASIPADMAQTAMR